MSSTRRLGSEAEDLAANYLIALGYTVLSRRFKARAGELDIVVLDGEVIVFVEVKMRSSDFIPAQEAVTLKKQQRIMRAAAEFLTKMELCEREIRYDTVSVQEGRCEHFIDAFNA